MGTILVVDDESTTRDVICRHLEADGFTTLQAESKQQAQRILQQDALDIAVLDIVLPDGTGFALAHEIRSRSDIGLIMISTKHATSDKITALELGADDYLEKPIDLRELSARIRSLLRRRRRDQFQPGQLRSFGDWSLDLLRRELTHRSGERVALTPGEFNLLSALVLANGMPVERDYLLELTSGQYETRTDRSVDTLISRLRRKLRRHDEDREIILTVHGKGYRLRDHDIERAV